MEGGNLGDSWPVGEGALENRIDYGPGYRIYYGIHGDKIILLHGGDKSTQQGDINTAVGRWLDFKERVKKSAAKHKLQSRPSRRPAK